MSDIDAVLNGVEDSDAFYDPSQDFDGVLPAGEYLVHVKEMDIKDDIVIKSKFLADIYVPTFIVAQENMTQDYDIDGHTVSGKAFVGRTIPHKGIFRFKRPDAAKYPQLSDSQGSNKKYMEFADALGMKVEEVDGRFKLPTLDEDFVKGEPAKVKVVHDKWIGRDGDEMVTPKVIDVFKWSNGKKVYDDIPF
tara:strand:- start:18 stop:593 length:576 start_codon:yes stop_codon:yes gene_type:complete